MRGKTGKTTVMPGLEEHSGRSAVAAHWCCGQKSTLAAKNTAD